MALNPELLAMLVCSACKQDLVYDPAASTLTCEACRLRYQVKNLAGVDVPDMLVEEAEKF